MSVAQELLERAASLREAADRERDETVAFLCLRLADAYELAAAAGRRPPSPQRLLH